MRSAQKESIPWKILMAFGGLAGELLDVAFSPPRSFSEVINSYRTRRNITLGMMNRNIKRLKTNDYIFVINKDLNLYQLTSKGKIEILKERIRRRKQQKWDSKWRLIVFDIPERSRRQRDLLRWNLKGLGFKQLQKSVWITPYDIEKEAKLLFNLFGYDKYIRFIIIEKINFDKDLRRYFSL